MWKFIPTISSMKTTVYNIINLFFCSHYSIEHYVRSIFFIILSLYSIKHNFTSFVECLEINTKIVRVFFRFLRLRNYFESYIILIQAEILVIFTSIIDFFRAMKL